MRWIGAVALFVLSFSMGLRMQYSMGMRVKILRQTEMLFHKLRTRLLYLQEPMQTAVDGLSREDGLSLLCLSACTALCREGVSFPDAWKEAVVAWQGANYLPEEQRTELSLLADRITSADTQGVREVLALYSELFGRARMEAEQKKEQTGKLYIRVGSAVGLLLGILIV